MASLRTVSIPLMVGCLTDLIGTVVAQLAKPKMIITLMAIIPQNFVEFFIEPPCYVPAFRLDKIFHPQERIS
jgi:hypothetical protein